MAFDAGILEGKNTLLHSESGSGKTLAYLMPILESMYKLDNLQDMRVQMDKSNEAAMFQNADELYHRLKNVKSN